LGDVRLTVKVSRAPLEPELQGVNVSSHGNWLATTLAGCEGKELSEYLLGDVEVPSLEEYQGPIKPFDNTRSGELNPKNELVAALYRFLGPNVDSVRRDLLAKRREQAKSEEAKKLASQAEKIAEALTRDFANFQLQLGKAKGAFPGNDPGTKSFAPLYGEDEGSLIEGGSELAIRVDSQEEPGLGSGLGGSSAPDLPTPVESDPEGDTTGRSRGGTGNRRGARGGILVAYDNLVPCQV